MSLRCRPRNDLVELQRGAYQIDWSATFGITREHERRPGRANVIHYDPRRSAIGVVTANNPRPTRWLTISSSATRARVPQAAGGLDVTKVADWKGARSMAPNLRDLHHRPAYPDGDCQSVGANGGTVSWPGWTRGLHRNRDRSRRSLTVSGGVSVAVADDQTPARLSPTRTIRATAARRLPIFISKAWLDASMNSPTPRRCPDFPSPRPLVGQANVTWSAAPGVSYTNQIPPALTTTACGCLPANSYTVSEAGLPAGGTAFQLATFPATWGSCDGQLLHTSRTNPRRRGVVVTKTHRLERHNAGPEPNVRVLHLPARRSSVAVQLPDGSVPTAVRCRVADLMPGQYDSSKSI